MLNRLRYLLSSSPRVKESPSPSGSLSLPPQPVVIRRALCQDEHAAAPASLNVEGFSSSTLDPPSTICKLLPPPGFPLETPSSSHLPTSPPDTIVQFTTPPDKVAQLNLSSPDNNISEPVAALKPSSTRRQSFGRRLSSPLRKLAHSISKTPSIINRQPASSAGSSLGPPSTICAFDDPRRALLPSTPYVHSPSSNVAADSYESLNTPPDRIAKVNPGTTNNDIAKSAAALKPSLANRFTPRPFSSPLRKLAHSISQTSSTINRKPVAIRPWTPGFHPSSSNFFAADSPVFIAAMAAKRSSPFAEDDFESPRTRKRIKIENQQDQSASPVTSLRQTPPSQPSSRTPATVYKSKNLRTPAPPARNRKRARVSDEDDDDDDYSASSHSDSDASQPNGVAKTDAPGKQTTIDKSPSPPNAPGTNGSNRRAKRPRRARSDSLYVDEEASDDGEFEIPEAHERNELGLTLTRERAQRLANAVKVPQDSNMCEEERDLYAELALRGIKPVMSYDWARDFSTLPESIFSVPNTSKEDEDKLTLKADKGTEFAAKKAFQELLKVGGCVRDCKILTVQPEAVIERAIRKYIRWAITDAGLKTTPETIPVHAIYTQKPGQSTLSAVAGLGNRLERLAQKHQKVHGHRMDTYCPSLVGFLICGPILSIMTLDTNPHSEVWTKDRGDGEDTDPRVKYLGLFDMSEIDSDVWNSLAVAMAVICMRKSMGRLANAYKGALFPRFRGQNDDSDDEDL